MSFNNLNDFNFVLNNNVDQFNQTDLNASNQPTSPSNILPLAAERFSQIQVTEDRLIEDSELGLYGLTAETEMGIHSEASSSSSSDYMDTTKEPSSSSSSSSTTRNSRKRNVQSAVSDIFEGRNPKKRRLDHSQMYTIYEPSHNSSSSSSPNEGMRFIPAAPSSSSSSPNEGMRFIPAAPSSSSSNEWCSFDPERFATRILDKIKSGNLNIDEYFPNNNFEITDAEWETLKEHLPDSIKKLTHPRGIINKFIEVLLHAGISDTYDHLTLTYKDSNGNILLLNSDDIKNDLYKIKLQICMRLSHYSFDPKPA